jgi:glycosyltransferase involved in cell wall biosynthesis
VHVFVDTSPRWSGGILAHLKGILTSGHVPDDLRVTILGTHRLLDAVGQMDRNVEAVVDDSMPLNPVRMHFWRTRNLPRLLRIHSPDVHFSVHGILAGRTDGRVKHVVMSRNLQPHLKTERRRIPFSSFERFRLEALHRTLKRSFSRADGVIFLTEYARDALLQEGVVMKRSAVIPHGLPERFRAEPERVPLPPRPVVLYVSDFSAYKFQWNVAFGVDLLRSRSGIDIQLHLIGGKSKHGWGVFERALTRLGNPDWIRVTEHVPYGEIEKAYRAADVFVFASTVETIGNILLEAMASGLPIACSNRRPMTDMLGDGGVFFEPEDPSSIASAVRRLLQDDELRYRSASSAYSRALAYTWKRTARETFGFIREVVSLRHGNAASHKEG